MTDNETNNGTINGIPVVSVDLSKSSKELKEYYAFLQGLRNVVHSNEKELLHNLMVSYCNAINYKIRKETNKQP